MRNFYLVAALALGTLMSQSAEAGLTRSLFLGGDATTDDLTVMNEIIGSDPRFDTSNSQAYSFSDSNANPTLAYLQQFNSVLVWTDSPGPDITGLSDVLRQYVDGGGRVVIGTFWGQQAGTSGGLNAPGYNPLTNPTANAYSAASLGTYDASNPLMQGVNTLSATMYRGDYDTGLDAGATLVASWDDGRPLEAVNAAQDVIAITLFPDSPQFGTVSGDYAPLFANALTTSAAPVPEPATLAVLGSGLLSLARVRRRKRAAGT